MINEEWRGDHLCQTRGAFLSVLPSRSTDASFFHSWEPGSVELTGTAAGAVRRRPGESIGAQVIKNSNASRGFFVS